MRYFIQDLRNNTDVKFLKRRNNIAKILVNSGVLNLADGDNSFNLYEFSVKR